MESNRNKTIDLLKGIAIYLVVFGHSIQFLYSNNNFYDDYLYRIIYSFHMPLFMLISGYLFYYSLKHDLKTIIVSKIKTLLYPMIIWGFIINIIVNFKSIEFSLFYFYKTLIGYWYIWFLFIYSVFVSLIYKLIDKKTIRIILYVVLFLLLSLFPYTKNGMIMFPYFMIGLLYCKNRETIDQLLNNKVLFFVVAFEIIVFISYSFISRDYIFDVYNKAFETFSIKFIVYSAIKYLAGFSGSIILVRIAKKVNTNNKLSIVISKWGMHSLEIYLVQRYLIEGLYNHLVNRFGLVTLLAGYNQICLDVIAFAFSIVFIIVINLIISLFRKIKINKVLFGR